MIVIDRMLCNRQGRMMARLDRKKPEKTITSLVLLSKLHCCCPPDVPQTYSLYMAKT